MIKRLMTTLQHRLRWWGLWVCKLRSAFFLDAVQVGGHHICLSYPEWDVERTEAECRHLFWDDPYGLEQLPTALSSVVDVGANIGFFSLLAKHRFPRATIHAYEPNAQLQPMVRHNTEVLGVVLHQEGIGGKAGFADLVTDGNTLTSTTTEKETGDILIVPLSVAVQRAGGVIDLLKMDCEGAEWQTFGDEAGWRCVKHLAMEYHLVPGTERTLPNLVAKLNGLGFAIQQLREASNPLVGLIHAVNVAFKPPHGTK
jgi:FkbM family methyltransferase